MTDIPVVPNPWRDWQTENRHKEHVQDNAPMKRMRGRHGTDQLHLCKDCKAFGPDPGATNTGMFTCMIARAEDSGWAWEGNFRACGKFEDKNPAGIET
jgi:hypothetical protein